MEAPKDDHNSEAETITDSKGIDSSYEELHRLAKSMIAYAKVTSINGSDLVSIAWLKLKHPRKYQSASHFRNAVIQAMRAALIDRARARNAKKRGGDWSRVPLDALNDSGQTPLEAPEARHVAILDTLELLNTSLPHLGSVMRIWIQEQSVAAVARELAMSESQVKHSLNLARAVIATKLGGLHGR